MDKIWDRNPSKWEFIGRCGGDEKNEWPLRTDKSRTLKKHQTIRPTNLNAHFIMFNHVYMFCLSFQVKHILFGKFEIIKNKQVILVLPLT